MMFSDLPSSLRLFKTVLFFLFLAEAGRQDFFTKKVSDFVWIGLFSLLFPTFIFEIFLFGFRYVIDVSASILIVFFFSIFCFYFGIFGGADGKSFLLFAVFFPIRFSFTADSLFISFLFSVFSSFAFSVFINSLFFAAVFSFSLFLFSISEFGPFSLKPLLLLKIPFFIPLFFGFLTAVLFGNIMLFVF